MDTDIGKAMLFPGASFAGGRYTVGWTVRPARKGEKPVDWSRWDPTNPDKLLRQYDWQNYGDHDELPYQAVDFVLNLSTGVTAELHTANPSWPWKTDGWKMKTASCAGSNGKHYGLVENGIGDMTEDFWLVSLGEKVVVADVTAAMRKAVNGMIRERRPERPNPDDYSVFYPLQEGGELENANGLAKVPFVAPATISDQREFGLSGVLTLRLSDGTIAGVSSDSKRLAPFVTNTELRKADQELNATYQAALESAPPKKAEVLKKAQREWISQRDAAAAQAVNVTPYDASEDVCERARENSLLESTKKRVQELKEQRQ